MTEFCDTYELQERAAILQTENHCEGWIAKKKAALEIEQRQANATAERESEAEKAKTMLKPARPRVNSDDIIELKKRRDIVGEKMRKEPDAARKAKLYEQWQSLCYRIIDLKKGK